MERDYKLTWKVYLYSDENVLKLGYGNVFTAP